jgi:hypothetical protein
VSTAAIRRYWTAVVEDGCNVDEWETIYGDQTKWLDAVKRRTGIDPWEMARGLMKPKPARRG